MGIVQIEETDGGEGWAAGQNFIRIISVLSHQNHIAHLFKSMRNCMHQCINAKLHALMHQCINVKLHAPVYQCETACTNGINVKLRASMHQCETACNA